MDSTVVPLALNDRTFDERVDELDHLFSNAKAAHSKSMKSTSSVAKHNSLLILRLERAFARDSELDLLTIMESDSYVQTMQHLEQADIKKRRRCSQRWSM